MKLKDLRGFQKRRHVLHRRVGALQADVHRLLAEVCALRDEVKRIVTQTPCSVAGSTCSCGNVRPPVEALSPMVCVADLGVFTVPDGYVHKTYPASFRERCGNDFVVLSSAGIGLYPVTNGVRRFVPGDRLHVQIFEQGAGAVTMFDKSLPFLQKLGAVFLGIRGLMLLHDVLPAALPAGRALVSFDGSTACSTAARLRVDVQEDGSTRRYLDQISTRVTGAECLIVCFTDALD